jgi:hypothetical protein
MPLTIIMPAALDNTRTVTLADAHWQEIAMNTSDQLRAVEMQIMTLRETMPHDADGAAARLKVLASHYIRRARLSRILHEISVNTI